MIAIFSTQGMEASTEQVMEWILHLKGSCCRINGQELNRLSLYVQNEEDSVLTINDQQIDLKDIGAVWYRRTANAPLTALRELRDPGTASLAGNHMRAEMRAMKRSLYSRLRHASWLSHTDHCSPNKFQMLQNAAELGLAVPQTLVTTSRADLLAFKHKFESIIVKPVSDTCIYPFEGAYYNQFTASLSQEQIEALPENFFPMLVQEQIDKTFEVRSFFLNGTCYSMAIFSQADQQTRTDFRVYNYKKKARTVPFQLNQQTTAQLVQLMAGLNLDTGSVDFMKGTDGKLYFLEVNPVGQFGMVSHPCNYRLERRIAEYLMEEDQACLEKQHPCLTT